MKENVMKMECGSTEILSATLTSLLECSTLTVVEKPFVLFRVEMLKERRVQLLYSRESMARLMAELSVIERQRILLFHQDLTTALFGKDSDFDYG